jgi:aldehyde dehydrogenase (NAD+)
MQTLKPYAGELLQSLGLDVPQGCWQKEPWVWGQGQVMPARTPVTGEILCQLQGHAESEVAPAVQRSVQAFVAWRSVPAPVRGELVRLLGQVLRRHKPELGALVSLEAGKILQEGLGEVQEMIDVCDFAVGLSRQLYGLTLPSERPEHRLMETWHPLGPVSIITAFNFPVAVWAWNAALALVCGNSLLWKPSEKTPLTALAVQTLFQEAVQEAVSQGVAVPAHLGQVLLGDAGLGQALVSDGRIPLISATGSTRMGRAVAQQAAHRLARTLLELGGNNAAIITPSADLALVERAVVFAAVGTAGQRCTTLRRLLVHESQMPHLWHRLQQLYEKLGQEKVGHPLEEGTLIGPLIDEAAYVAMQAALQQAREQGGQVCGGQRVRPELGAQAYYVQPALVRLSEPLEVVQCETFAPILYVMPYAGSLDEAIAMNNAVAQGLSSSIFTTDLREAERFLGPSGSDCGIANVNIGTSGAEIGGAFGGEKETGGGRESGSDAWKAYMRRATNTINYGTSLPLAQGIRFNLEG